MALTATSTAALRPRCAERRRLVKTLSRLLPRSLVGRVYALYAATLLVFVGGSTALFYQSQFSFELETVQKRADTLMAVVFPTVSDNAVIGDYDSIRRILRQAIHHSGSDFASASYIDRSGGVIREADATLPDVSAPSWLQHRIAEHLYDTNRPISVGGRDYGVLRLSFSPERIAGELWRRLRLVLGLAMASLIGGLLLIRLPLVGWLGDLGQVRAYDLAMQTGSLAPSTELTGNRPSEMQETFDVLDRAAASLHSQRERASVTLAAIGDGVLTLNANGTVLYANPVASAMLERPAREMVGLSVRSLCPHVFPEGKRIAPWRDQRATLQRRNGQIMVVETTLSAISDKAGELVGHVLACRDVTAKNTLDQRLLHELRSREMTMASLRSVLEGLMPQSQEESGLSSDDDLRAVTTLISSLVVQLQERNEQLNTIAALSPDGFVTFDLNRRVNYVSPAFSQLTGLPDYLVRGLEETAFEAQLATHCSAESPPSSFVQLRKLNRATGQGQYKREFLEIERPTKRVLEIRLRESQSIAISQVFYLRDVTHETEVDQMKTEFLSTAAHEMRTPMASIYGFSELLLSRDLAPDQQREMLEIVHRQTELMITIINELLDLARIEARRGKDFKLDSLDLATVAHDVVHDFKPPDNREAVVTEDASKPLPAVLVDRNKIAQVLGNVLSNAYKYSPDGGAVRLRFLTRKDGNGETQIGVQVQDHGIGMSPEQLARVSERFYRADTSGRIPGTGLGMSIVKEIVELMSGSLEISSELGRGSQVTLWLPAAPRPVAAVPVPA